MEEGKEKIPQRLTPGDGEGVPEIRWTTKYFHRTKRKYNHFRKR
jgi:hypothetical protein